MVVVVLVATTPASTGMWDAVCNLTVPVYVCANRAIVHTLVPASC